MKTSEKKSTLAKPSAANTVTTTQLIPPLTPRALLMSLSLYELLFTCRLHLPSLHFVWLCRTSSDGKRTKSLTTDSLPAVSIPRSVFRSNLSSLISITFLQLRFHWQILSLILSYSYVALSYIHYVNQLMQSINYNKTQTKKYNSWQISNSYMFRHRCAILRDSTITWGIPVQHYNLCTDFPHWYRLKYYYSRIPRFEKNKFKLLSY